jgi:hypothetical protein
VLIIPKQLHSGDHPPEPEWWQSLLFLCRKLHPIILPLRYRKVVLTERLLRSAPGDETGTPICNIRAHCQHIVIKQALEWDKAALFISQCPRVQDLTTDVPRFSVVPSMEQVFLYSEEPRRSSPIPQVLTDLISSRKFRLHMPRLVFGPNYGTRRSHVDSIPAENLVSVKAFQSDWRWNHAGGKSFNHLLVRCRNLQSLSLVQTDLNLFRAKRGKLPAIRELRLEDCHRVYQPERFDNIWDLSRVEHLHIGSVFFETFLANGRATELVQLKKLEIWYGRKRRTVWHPKKPSVVSSTLERVLCNNPNLQTLEVGGIIVQALPIAAIAKLENLKVLKLRDFSEIKEDQKSKEKIECKFFNDWGATPPEDPYMQLQFPSISEDSLKLIQQSCTFITELDLGFEKKQSDASTSKPQNLGKC